MTPELSVGSISVLFYNQNLYSINLCIWYHFLLGISNTIKCFYRIYKTKMAKFILYANKIISSLASEWSNFFDIGEQKILVREGLYNIL